jgi:hypothetical protein
LSICWSFFNDTTRCSVQLSRICTVLLGQSNLRYSGHVVMMAKTCLIHNSAGKSLTISRLEMLRFLQIDNIATAFSEVLVTDVDGVTHNRCHYLSAIYRITAYLIVFLILFLLNASLYLYSATSSSPSIHTSTHQTHDQAIPHLAVKVKFKVVWDEVLKACRNLPTFRRNMLPRYLG